MRMMKTWKIIEENRTAIEIIIRKLAKNGIVNYENLEDAIQDGLIALYEKSDKFDERASFKTFAATVLKNHFLDECKKENSQKRKCDNIRSLDELVFDTEENEGRALAEFIKSDVDSENEVLNSIMENDIKKYFQKVKKNCTAESTVKGLEALEMKIEGYSAVEIAEKYNVPANSIRAWLSRAKKLIVGDVEFIKIISLD